MANIIIVIGVILSIYLVYLSVVIYKKAKSIQADIKKAMNIDKLIDLNPGDIVFNDGEYEKCCKVLQSIGYRTVTGKLLWPFTEEEMPSHVSTLYKYFVIGDNKTIDNVHPNIPTNLEYKVKNLNYIVALLNLHGYDC